MTITEHKVIPLNYTFVNNTLDDMEIKLKINNSFLKIGLNSVKGLFFNKKTKIWRLVKNSDNPDKMQYVLEKNVGTEILINSFFYLIYIILFNKKSIFGFKSYFLDYGSIEY